MDKISVKGITEFGHHGCTEEERKIGQTLEAEVTLGLDLRQAGTTDKLSATANYAKVTSIAREIIANTGYKLLESIAEDIARRILADTRAVEVSVTVRKPNAPVGVPGVTCSVEIFRRAEDYAD